MNLKISDPGLIGALVAHLSVGLSSTTAVRNYSSSGNQMTPSVTATPTGGVAPYTYSWVQDGSGNTFTPSSPSSAATFWSIMATFPNGYTASWKCQVTDSRGFVANSADVSVVVAP